MQFVIQSLLIAVIIYMYYLTATYFIRLFRMRKNQNQFYHSAPSFWPNEDAERANS